MQKSICRARSDLALLQVANRHAIQSSDDQRRIISATQTAATAGEFACPTGFWDQAKAWQPYSLFHHFQAADILAGSLSGLDLIVLCVAIVIPLAYALYVFPRRDLPAPD